MHPLLTFSTGILAGVAAVRWLKSGKAKAKARAAQQTLRGATISGLSAVEASSARLRTKLTPTDGAGKPGPDDTAGP